MTITLQTASYEKARELQAALLATTVYEVCIIWVEADNCLVCVSPKKQEKEG